MRFRAYCSWTHWYVLRICVWLCTDPSSCNIHWTSSCKSFGTVKTSFLLSATASTGLNTDSIDTTRFPGRNISKLIRPIVYIGLPSSLNPRQLSYVGLVNVNHCPSILDLFEVDEMTRGVESMTVCLQYGFVQSFSSFVCLRLSTLDTSSNSRDSVVWSSCTRLIVSTADMNASFFESPPEQARVRSISDRWDLMLASMLASNEVWQKNYISFSFAGRGHIKQNIWCHSHQFVHKWFAVAFPVM